MFNTFPTQSSSESTGTTTSSGDLGPVLNHSPLPAYYNNVATRNLEGFASLSRSSVSLPSNDTTNLVLFDSTGSTIWSYVPGNLNAAADRWAGFWLNDDATLLYVFASDTTVSPNAWYTFTIDAAGTIVELGNDQPALEFTNTSQWWTSGTGVQPDGTGGFKILHNVDAITGQYAILDSAGQFTTQPTDYYDDGIGTPQVSAVSPYETESGYIISGIVLSVDGRLNIGISNKYLSLQVNVSRDTFVGHATSSSSEVGAIRWRDYVVPWDNNTTRGGLVKYSVSDFDKYASEMAEYYGVIE